MKKILITSPSLDANDNVSGISSLISDILSNGNSNFIHFIIGRKDGSKKNVVWLFYQFAKYFKFIWLTVFREYEIIHINSSMEPPAIFRDTVFSLLAKNLFKKKVVLHLHGGYYLMNKPQNRILTYFIKTFFKTANAIIVLSSFEEEMLTQNYGKFNYQVFPNSVDTKYLKMSNKRTARGKDKIHFIFLGSINEAKGIFTISESLHFLTGYFDSFVFDIFGTGPDVENWLKSLSKFPDLQFHYNGVIKGQNKWEMLTYADVFLLPSFHEGLPMAMLEAMAAGCVVVVSDDATMSTVVSNKVNGIIIPKRDPEYLANQIKDIINGKVDMDKIGNNAMNYIQNNLSFSSYISKLNKLYSDL